MMFESWISDLLASSLGHFIDVKTEQLKVGLWQGVTIENAKIRSDAFDHLKLPLHIRNGSIGHLQIQVPWRALNLSPVVIHISDVSLCVEPPPEWTLSALQTLHSRAKQAELLAAEFRRVSSGVASSSTLFWQLGSQVWNAFLRRCQFKIDSIQIQFQGQRAPHLAPYSFGIEISTLGTVEGLEIAEHQPRNPLPDREILKSVSVVDLSLFWIPDEGLDSKEECYLLSPTSFQIFLYLQSHPGVRSVECESYLVGPQLEMALTERQLVSMTSFLDDCTIWPKRAQYSIHRPENWKSQHECNILRRKKATQTDSAALWKYAIQSVLQDLCRAPLPSFSWVHLRRYASWRRLYLPLYTEKLKNASVSGSELSHQLQSKLEAAENLLSVEAVMLFRTIAEGGALKKGPTLPEHSRWMKWNLSTAFGLFQSSPQLEALSVEAEDEAEIEHLYSRLQAESTSSAILASLEVQLEAVTFLVSSTRSELLDVSVEGVKMDAEITPTRLSYGLTLSELLVKDLTSSRSHSVVQLSQRPAVELHYAETGLAVEVHGLRLTACPKLLTELQLMQSQLPKWPLKKWCQLSGAALETKRSRVLSQLPPSFTLPPITIHLQAPQLLMQSSHSTDSLVLAAVSVEAAWKPRETWDVSMASLSDIEEDGFVLEMLDPLLYAKWSIAFNTVSVQLSYSTASHALMEPFSATGNLLLNLSVLEPSLPTLITDWRVTPLILSVTPEAALSLGALLEGLQHDAEVQIWKQLDLGALSSDGVAWVELQLAVESDRISVVLSEVCGHSFVDTFSVQSSAEVSLSFPRFKLIFEDSRESSSSLSTAFSFISQTGALDVTLMGESLSVDCTLQTLTLQDLSNYGTSLPQIVHLMPRLGRNISAKEFSLCISHQGRELHARGKFSGVEGNGYLHEAGGQIHSNQLSNTVSFVAEVFPGRAKYTMDLDHVALGSTFLVRFFGFLLPPSEHPLAEPNLPHGQILRISVLGVELHDSYIAFPRELSSTEKIRNASLVVQIPEGAFRSATAHLALGDGHVSGSVMEIEQFRMRDLRFLVPLDHPEHFVTVFSLQHLDLIPSSATPLSNLSPQDSCYGREVQSRVELGQMSGYLNGAALEMTSASLATFQAVLSSAFPPTPSPEPHLDPVPILHLKTEVALKMEPVSIHLMQFAEPDPHPFCISLMGLSLQHCHHSGVVTGSVSWEDFSLVWLTQLPDVTVFDLRPDGLFHASTPLETSGEPKSKTESLDEEESGSVSSSTSWQTAGSHLSTSRRAGPSQPISSEFESVEESKPFLQLDADHELSPFLETISDDSSHSEPDLLEIEPERDQQLDLLLMRLLVTQGGAIEWEMSLEGERGIRCAPLECIVNVPHLSPLLNSVQELLKSQIHPSGEQSTERGVLEGTVVMKEVRVTLCDVPLLTRTQLAEEPPRLLTELLMRDIQADISPSRPSLQVSAVEMESRWIQCHDPSTMQMEAVRKLGPLVTLSYFSLGAQLPDPHQPSGLHNQLSLDAEIKELSLDASLQKLKPVERLAGHFQALFSSLQSPQRATQGAASRHLLHQHHVRAAMCIPSCLLKLEDDSQQCAFPLMKASILDFTCEAETLVQSETVVWELSLLPEVSLYNRQNLGWECLLQGSPWSFTGSVVLATMHPDAVMLCSSASVQISAAQPVEISVSPGMIRTLMKLKESAKPLSEYPEQLLEILSVSYWIQNHTGSDVECTQLGSPSSAPFLTLQPNERHSVVVPCKSHHPGSHSEAPALYLEGLEGVDCEDYEASMRQSMQRDQIQLAFRLADQLAPCGPLSPITPGTVRFSIQSNSALYPATRDVTDPIDRLFSRSVPKTTVLACDVHVKAEGAMEVELRSDFQLCNQTAYRLEVGCWRGEEIRPQITHVEPQEQFWIPIMTVAHGKFAIRPQPASTDRYPLRCAWSQPLSLEHLPQGDSCTRLRCEAVSGGLKSIWLLVGVHHHSPEDVSSICIQAPVIVHNYLPIPLDVAVSCDSGKSTALKGKLMPRCSMQGYTLHGEEITTLRMTPANYHTTDVALTPSDASHVPTASFLKSREDLMREDHEIPMGAGLVPVMLKHRVEGFTGRHVFELCCALWIYNCTATRFAVQQTGRLEEGNMEEDTVPDRWVPPYNQSLPHGSHPLQSHSSASALGLQSLLEKGQPERFRLRSGSPALPTEERTNRVGQRSLYASLEMAGTSHHGPFRLQFRTSGSQAPLGTDYWSEAVWVEGTGAAVVKCSHPMHATSTSPAYPNAAYYLAISCVPIPQCGGSAALHVLPRYVLNNSTAFHFQYRQQGIQMEKELPLDVTQSMHWPDVEKPLLLSIRVQEAGWMWSGGLRMDAPGDTMVKLRHRMREETLLIQMDVSLQANGVLLSTLMHQPSGFAPYRLDNFTCEKIHVRQSGSGNQEDILRPYSSMPYAWDEPAGQHRVILEGPGRRLIGQFKLDAVGVESKAVVFPETSDSYSSRVRHLKIIIQAEGPTRVLALLDEDVHPELPLPKPSPQRRRLGHGVPPAGLEFTLKLPWIGVSLVSEEREMVYVRAMQPQMQLSVRDARYSVSCSVQQFQVDACRRHITYPVLARGPVTQETWTGMMGTHQSRRALEFVISVWRQRPGGVLCLELLSVDVAPFALNMEEGSLRPLMQYLTQWMPRSGAERNFQPEFVLAQYHSPINFAPKLKIYLEKLSVSPCVVNFSFCPSEQRSEAAGGSFLERIISLANFEGAQIRLSALELKHPLLSVHAMVALIARHYTTSLLQELYKVVGSADILGDPVHLVQSLGLGVWLLFANPTYAFVKSRALDPGRWLMGVVSGVASLFANVVFGLSNATAKISLAARRSLMLFFPPDSQHPSSTDLLKVILESAVGVLSSAAQGLDERGLLGFCQGLSTGLMQLIARPLALTLKLISDLTESLSHSLSGMMKRVRLLRVPRHVTPSYPLQSYNLSFSIGSVILEEVWNGAFQRETLHKCFSGDLPDDYLLVTQRYFLVARWKTPLSPFTVPTLTLAVALEDIECIKRRGRDVIVFGFVPQSCWRSQMMLRQQLGSPFFCEVVKCADVMTTCYLSLMLKVSCEQTPKKTTRMGYGYSIRHL